MDSQLYKDLKKKNKIIGFTSVVGDLLHCGHIAMIQECKRHCDYLMVGLVADPTIDRPDKKNKPVESLYERYYRLVNTKGVDEVIPLLGEDDLYMCLAITKADIRFVGDDYIGKDFTGKQLCLDKGMKIIYNDRSHKLSSTSLRERVLKAGELKK